MHGFHGDLLIGGMAIRDLDGEIEDTPQNQLARWSGRFRLDSSRQQALELGRPYLLMLDDGRTCQIEVTEMHVDPEQACLVVQFGGCT